MKHTIRLLIVIAIAGLGAANAKPPTKESVERLVVAAGVDAVAVTLQGQVEGMMKNFMAQAFPPGSLDKEGTAIMDSYASKIGRRYAAELSGEKIRAIYAQVFGTVYTQEEIDGQIAFYESNIGRAVVAKNAAMTESSMRLMQQLVGVVMQGLQKALQEATIEIRAKAKKG